MPPPLDINNLGSNRGNNHISQVLSENIGYTSGFLVFFRKNREIFN